MAATRALGIDVPTSNPRLSRLLSSRTLKAAAVVQSTGHEIERPGLVGWLRVAPLLRCPVDVRHALGDFPEQLGRVKSTEALLRCEQGLLDDRRRILHLLEPLGRRRPQPHPSPAFANLPSSLQRTTTR
jgi:hypothetical protein